MQVMQPQAYRCVIQELVGVGVGVCVGCKQNIYRVLIIINIQVMNYASLTVFQYNQKYK